MKPTNFNWSFSISADWWIYFSVALFIKIDKVALGLIGSIPAILQPVAAVGQVDAVAAVAAEVVLPALKERLLILLKNSSQQKLSEYRAERTFFESHYIA